MNKVLKVDDINVLFVASGTAYPKEVFEQMIISFQRGAGWTVETAVNLVITHSDTVGGAYTAFDTVNVAVPGAGAVGMVAVNPVAMKDFFKITMSPATVLQLVAILADSRNVDTATENEFPDGTPRALLSESFYNL